MGQGADERMTDRHAEAQWWLEQATDAEKEKRPADAASFLRYAIYYDTWTPWSGYGDYTKVHEALAKDKAFQVMRFLIPTIEWRMHKLKE